VAGPLNGGPRSAATRGLFLDRDGVINEKAAHGRYIEDSASFRFLPGVIGSLVSIRAADPAIALMVVTNQRGIATGALTDAVLSGIHESMAAELGRHGVTLDGIYICPHERDSCDCRKPRPGLLHQAALDFPALRFPDSRLVGDALADLQAAAGVGMPAFLVGDAPSRARTSAEARSLGVPVAGQAGGLAELVRAEPMRQWLADISSTPVPARPPVATH